MDREEKKVKNWFEKWGREGGINKDDWREMCSKKEFDFMKI